MNWIGFLIAKSIQLIGTEIFKDEPENQANPQLARSQRSDAQERRTNPERQGLSKAEEEKAIRSAKGS